MVEAAVSCAPATTAECAIRELAQRQSGTVEVLLLWHPEGDWVELSLHDPAVGADFRVEVDGSSALDAFYHPYAYTAGPESDRAGRDEATIDDG